MITFTAEGIIRIIAPQMELLENTEDYKNSSSEVKKTVSHSEKEEEVGGEKSASFPLSM